MARGRPLSRTNRGKLCFLLSQLGLQSPLAQIHFDHSLRLRRNDQNGTTDVSASDVLLKNPSNDKRQKNLILLAQKLPDWGVDARVSKRHWAQDAFYEVKSIKVYKCGKTGAAWGVFHEAGTPKTGEVERIGGVNKPVWRVLKESRSKGWEV